MTKVVTKEIPNGKKLVIVRNNNGNSYAPKYSELKEIIAQLGSLYGKEEVIKELGLGKTTTFPKKSDEWKKRWKYKFRGEISVDSYHTKIISDFVDKEGRKISFIKLSYISGLFRLCFKTPDSDTDGEYRCTDKLSEEEYSDVLKDISILSYEK